MTYDYGNELIEQQRGWRSKLDKIPFIQFPTSWEIQMTPPFGGADARFRVRKGEAEVSIYLDFDGRLGHMEEPYWEVYPVDGDVHRSLLNETDDLLKAIAKSIRQQNGRAKK